LVLEHAAGENEALLQGWDTGDGLDFEFEGADGGGGAVAIEGVFVALRVQDADGVLKMGGVGGGGGGGGGGGWGDRRRGGWSAAGGGEGRGGGDGGGGDGGGEDCGCVLGGLRRWDGE